MTEYEGGLAVEVAFPPEQARSLAQAFSEIVVGVKTAHYWTSKPWDEAHPDAPLVQQTVEISEAKVDDKALSFKVALEGRTPMITGERVGEQLKLVVDGVSNPVLLSRVK